MTEQLNKLQWRELKPIKDTVWDFLQPYHLFPNGGYERAAIFAMVDMLNEKGFLRVVEK